MIEHAWWDSEVAEGPGVSHISMWDIYSGYGPENPYDGVDGEPMAPINTMPAPAAPAPSESGGEHAAPAAPGNGAWGNYLSWQRKNLKKLLKQYRKDFPEYLRGWKEDSYADLDKATDKYGQASMVDVWKRGLGKSPAWQAGSKLDTAGFQEKGGRDIEAMAQQMQMDAQQKMAAAIGRPDQGYAQSAGMWNQYQGQMDWQNQQEWMMNFQTQQYLSGLQGWDR